MSVTTMPVTTTDLRARVEDFLFHEAELLDDWKLEPWLELFTQDCTYEVPATDRPQADPGRHWSLIHDGRTILEQRVIRLKKPEAHAEFPHSQTRRIIGNVRVRPAEDDTLAVKANFILTRMKGGKFDIFPGQIHYELVPHEESFRIRRKRIVLDMDRLEPHGKISFVL